MRSINNKKFFYIVLVLFIVLLGFLLVQVMAPSEEPVDTDADPMSVDNADVVVNIGEMYFQQADSDLPENELSASVGDTVAFHNEGTIPHTATLEFYEFDEVVQPGETVFLEVNETAEETKVDCLFHLNHEAVLTVTQ